MGTLAASTRGHLLLADISGYTAFLAGSELGHAQEVVAALLESLMGQLRDPWRVCEVEGDAVFAYAPEVAMLRGETALEIVEALYAAFASSREQMRLNTTCNCAACRLIPTLDLKIVVHFGDYVLQRLRHGGEEKPSGPEVVLAHRLLKNSIAERWRISAYAFLTDASVEASGSRAVVEEQMTRHAEEYPHLGRVEGFVYDLHPFWARERDRRRELVRAEDAWIRCEIVVPAPPQIVWEYLLEPERKRRWRDADELRVAGLKGGRMDVGSAHHCVHGDMVIAELVLDLRPFHYVTFELQWPLRARMRSTTQLAAVDGGTRLTLLVERPRASDPLWRMVGRVVYGLQHRSLVREHRSSLERLRDLVPSEAGRGSTAASE